MTRVLVLSAGACWIALTMLLAEILGVAHSPDAARSAALVQYVGLMVVCGVIAIPRRRTR